jgi:CRISPR-associated endonuclease/helicase Cas3
MWNEGILDLSNPNTFGEYYRRVYSLVDRDPGVLAAERDLRFKCSAELFKMIDDSGQQVVAPFGKAEEQLAELAFTGITRMAMRRLQPFLVTLYQQEIEELRKAGAIVPIADGCDVWRVLPQFRHVYNERFGFRLQGPLAADPESLIG